MLVNCIFFTIYLINMTHDHKSENYLIRHNNVFSYVAEMCFHNRMHIVNVHSKHFFCMHGIPRFYGTELGTASHNAMCMTSLSRVNEPEVIRDIMF